jgi:hypothetical protein
MNVMDNNLIIEIINQIIIDKTITIISAEYYNFEPKINWICKKCNYFWKTSVTYIVDKKTCCPHCADKAKLSNEIIDQILLNSGRTIIRLGNFNGCKSKIDWQCIVCNYIWGATSLDVMYHNTKCPKCIGHIRLTNLIIDQRLIDNNRSIIRLGNCNGSAGKIDWQCKNCNYIWNTAPNSIFSGKSNCPKCSNVLKLTKDIINERFSAQNRTIILIGNYINVDTLTEWQCKNCNFIWIAEPNNVIYRGDGCKKCGLSRGERATLSILEKNNIKFEQQYKITIYKRNCKIDFYIPYLNLFIEYNGRQHYEPMSFKSNLINEKDIIRFKAQKERDENLRKYCNKNNINLLEIDERKYTEETFINYKLFLEQLENDIMEYINSLQKKVING